MNAVVISDVHLRSAEEPRAIKVLRFLNEVAPNFSSIYILGDLFDSWPGTNRLLIHKYSPILTALEDLVRGGRRVHYIEGNHDFRLGKYFSEKLGIQVHPDYLEQDWGSKKVYLAHGDLGNPKQNGYRILRAFLRSNFTHLLLKTLPPQMIDSIGKGFSKYSRDSQKSRWVRDAQKIKNIYRETAGSIFQKGYDVVVFGHTHYPDSVAVEVMGRQCLYFNTGDWLQHFTYLEFDGREFYTKTYSDE